MEGSRAAGCLFAIAAAFVPLVAAADTYPRQPGADVLGYVFRLTLSDDTDAIEGEAAIDVRFVADGLARFELDLATPSLTAPDRGMRVLGVSEEDVALGFRHQDDRLTMTLARPAAAGERRRLTVRYSGVPATGLVIRPNKHGDRGFFSDNWPDKARQWLPVVDHPYDKATCEFDVKAPAHYQVVSNGLQVEETDVGVGRRRTRWVQSVPIAPWLFVLGVSPFAVEHRPAWRGVPIQTWVYPQDRAAGFHDFAVPTADALEFFHTRIGPYAYEKLANVQSNSVRGGMESASAIFYGDDSVTGQRSIRWRNVVIHEIAHQWWGNAVTERDWDDVWLSEGFATYFTLLYTEQFEGHDAFVRGLRSSRDRILQLEKKTPDTPIVHRNLADMRRVLNQLIYQKGGWTLHMLRYAMGTERFWDGIREYYRRYQNTNASTDDFRTVMERHAGRDLSWLFSQWLTRSGVPALAGIWTYDAAARQIVIELTQTQAGDAYRLPLDIGIASSNGAAPRVERIELTGRGGRFTIAADTAPADLVLDPNTWVLMEPPVFSRRQQP
jgi:aminopeptidase N